MPRELYHFCADHLLVSILENGLTLGMIAWMEDGRPHFKRGYQWLTTDPDRDHQQWCDPEFSTLPYDRCANRITVVIPKSSRNGLHCWTDIGPLLVPKDQYDMLNAFGDPSVMYVYQGRVPPRWFRSVDRLGARWALEIVPRPVAAKP